MLKILHFADAHIDMANFGRHDAQTGLPVRVMDFLKSMDEIVDTAINERVDMVLFAGDAYKDRTPPPTFQREWGRRLMRLSKAAIPTFLLVGNHDLSPAMGRAHALESFDTLEVPHIHVLDRPCFLKPDQLEGLPLQLIALPWIFRSGYMAFMDDDNIDVSIIFQTLEERFIKSLDSWLREADKSLPVVLTAHCSIQGAVYGGERTVMLGNDLVLSPSLVKDQRLAYVALGHIHKSQDLNEGAQPPVVYPGSIERVDFGEAQDDKYFVIAHVEHGKTRVEWRKLENIRPFIDRFVRLRSAEGVTDRLRRALPPANRLAGAVVRLVIEYPRDWETLIDEAALREYAGESFEFQLVKRPQIKTRVRLPQDQTIGSLSPLELLKKYWEASHLVDSRASVELNQLAAQVIREVHGQPDA